jgi:hypothetical protein
MVMKKSFFGAAIFLAVFFIFSHTTLAITNIGSDISTTGNLTVDGSLKLTSGANDTYILTTDASGKATWIAVGSALTNATTDSLPQGATNKYYDGTDADNRADARINAQKGANSGLATLDAGGKIPSSQIPALVISNTYVVTDQASLLGLSANVGDIAVQTDENKTFILQAEPASSLSNWIQIITSAQVVSFNGRTGSVAPQAGDYTANDVGLGTGSAPIFSGLTLSNLAPGSITFTGANSLISQDNTNFFWDSANSRLGIKNNTPAYALDVAGDIKAGDGSLLLLGSKIDPDPTGVNGSMYYNSSTNKFRCFENSSWKDCDTTGGTTSLQTAYNSGATITTAGSTDFSVILSSGDFNVSGDHAVIMTPVEASKFTSSGALTLTGGASSNWSTTAGALNITSADAATWGTSAGDLTLQAGGAGTTANIFIGSNTGSATPDLLVLDVKNTAGDPTGIDGAMYYNSDSHKYRCFENSSWKDCDTTGSTASLQTAYSNEATITTVGSTDINLALASGNFTANGLGAVNLNPIAASSFTSSGALTLTGGAASTWGTTAGDLTIDSAGALNLGATNTTGISLGNSGAITTINGPLAISSYEDFPLIAAPTYKEGRVFYDNQTKSLSYYTDIAGIQMHIGKSIWSVIKNSTGSLIPKGSVVYVNGTDGAGTATIALAKADNALTSQANGIITQDIANGSKGYMTYLGAVYNLDTSSFSEGDTLYLSPTTAGALTATKPSYPNYSMPIATVAVSDPLRGAVGANISTFKEGSFTPGSITFAGTDGLNAQDTTNFFWDNTNKRLGIGDNTPLASLTVGAGDLFEVFGNSGNITTQGDITLTNGGGAITAIGGTLNLIGNDIQIGTGAGSATPNLLTLDIKNTTGDPSGTNGAMYYNNNAQRLRCYENNAWKDCDTGAVASLQTAFYNGGSITTASSTPIAFNLASGNFTAGGLGAINFTPTSASSFTSGGALTLTGGAASTWGTTVGNLNLQAGSGIISLGTTTDLLTNTGLAITTGTNNITLQPAGINTTANVQIGSGAGSATPDLLVLDVKNTANDPTGTAGAIYYSSSAGRFRCFENGSWKDCDTTGGTANLQTTYNSGGVITTASSTDLAFNLASGNFTAGGFGAINFTPTSASSFTSGGALTLTGGAASTWGTTVGNLNLQVAGTGTTANVQIGSGVGSATPDLLVLDTKSDSSDPLGYNGAMYYNNNLGKFRCYESNGWKDCDTGIAAGSLNLQQVYNSGGVITTASSTDLAFNLASGNFTAGGFGAINFTPTSASSFTSGGALTLTGGAASTWGTTAGNLNLQVAGTGTTANVQIGSGAGSATPDLLVLDIKNSIGDPLGTEGAMYFNSNVSRFRCYQNGAWKDCDVRSNPISLQLAYTSGATITTASSTDLAFNLASGNFTAGGLGAINFTPTSASSFISGGALTIDSGATLSLGATNATGISIGKLGAVATINGSLAIPNYLDITTASNPSFSEGRLFYDSGEKTLAYYNENNQETVNLGQEELIRIYNQTGILISSGQAVYINGIFNNVPTIALAKADNENTSRAIGVTTVNIPNNSYGYVTSLGLIHDLNTSAYSPGDHIYLSDTVAGGLSITKPLAPSMAVPLGYITKSDATHGIFLSSSAAHFPGLLNPGAIPFGTASGELNDDNVNLFWDNTNKRLGIGDNTPPASLTVGAGDMFEVFGDSGNITTQGNINLSNNGGNITAIGGALNLISAASSTFLTSAGNIILQPSDIGTTANVQIGSGAGSATPDLLVLDVKNTANDPTGTAGAIYYSSSAGRFRCFENGSWKDCDTTGGTVTLQSSYNSGATITTASSTNIAFNLTSGSFTATGAGAVNLTPTSASSFTSGGTLTLTGGATSTLSTTAGTLNITSAASATWGTTFGNLKLQAGGTGTTNNIQIGIGGSGSVTPDLLALDVKSDASDPTGFNGAMYYNLALAEFRCYENGAWMDCDGQNYLHSLQTAYNSGGAITTASSTNIAFNLTSGSFTATGAGAVNLTPTSASSFTSGGTLTLTGGAASTWGTTAGNLNLQVAGTGTTANVQIGSGAGSATPDLLVADIKTTIGDPTGTAGAIYYNSNLNKFRCFENGSWKDCDTAGITSLQQAYYNNPALTTASSTNIAFNLASGNFTATGAGAVNLTPTSASSFTSGGTLTLTSGAASTWGTTAGNLTIDSGGVLNLGTINATGIYLGKNGITTTNNGALTSTQTLTASNGLTLTTGTLNLTATGGTLTLSGLSASSINTGANALTFTSSNFKTTTTGINSTAIGPTTPSTGAFTNLTIGSGGTPISKHFSTTDYLDFPSLNNTCGNITTPVNGASVGDTAIATPTAVSGGIETLNINWNSYVSAANTVTIRICSVGTNNPAGQTWRVDVWSH